MNTPTHSALSRKITKDEEHQAYLEAGVDRVEKKSTRRSAATHSKSDHSIYNIKLQTAAEGEWLQAENSDENSASTPSRTRYDWRQRAKAMRKPNSTASISLPKRVRPTIAPGPVENSTSLAIEDYSQKFTKLLALEEAEDAASVKHRLATWSLQQLQEEGYCIVGLTGEWVSNVTQYGRPVATLQLGPGIELPKSRLTNGVEVILSRFNHASDTPIVGSVLSVTDSTIMVCFKNHFDINDTWRIDIGQPGHTFERMRAAITSLEHDPLELEQTPPVDGGEHILQGTMLRDVIIRRFKDEFKERDETSPSAVTVKGDQETSNLFQHNGIFKNDQRIQSWARRYSRTNPVVVEGDPPLDGLNSSQIQAVAAMIGERISLVQGPPGTGKTKVIIEAIKLLKVHFEVPHPIVVCTFTNVALDNLVEGFVKAGVKPLRIGHHQAVRPELLPYSLDAQLAEHHLAGQLLALTEEEAMLSNLMFKTVKKVVDLEKKIERETASGQGSRQYIHTKLGNLKTAIIKLTLRQRYMNGKKYHLQQRMLRDTLNHSDVICTTCLTAACHALAAIDFPVVFIDEASMSTEPASLIPIMKGSQHVVLIGDHKQLPPVIISDQAKEDGLGISLFERLINEGNVPSVMLDIQYRMHPAISRFPAKEFYNLALRDGTVDAGGKALPGLEPPHSQHHTEFNTSAGRPAVIFLDHKGSESVKGRSFQNVLEARIVASVVEDLLLNNPQLQGSDIGVISPYVSQIHLLKRLFNTDAEFSQRLTSVLGHERAQQCHAIEVRTVDGFEGREKQVIIFSTVRNNAEGRIGFLADQKRLNVGLTRAKRGLFVVGSLSTLRAGGAAERYRAQRAIAEADLLEDLSEVKPWVLEIDDLKPKKKKELSKTRLIKTIRSAKGAESWNRYAEYLQEGGFVVKLTGRSLSKALHGHLEAAKKKNSQTIVQ